MSFDVVLKRNKSETIAVTKKCDTIATLTGVLRDGSSIINPVIMIEAPISLVRTANYLTVSEFERSYFINNITSVRNNLVELNCHVDVLSSFAAQIRANKGIVFRQESNWNLYLNDGVIEVYQNPIVTTKQFPNSFEGESYVLVLAGRRAGGDGGPGVLPGGGGGSEGAKSMSGLAEYVYAQLGKPYWFGTFGQIASQTLLDNRRTAYPEYYTAADFPSQFGQRVHDCVGLIKGYRWSESATSTPVYNASQDVSAAGLYGECSAYKGKVGDDRWTTTYYSRKGVCLFTATLDHVGVSMGDGTAIEARGHAYGVVRTNLTDRNWFYWGVPDWLLNNTGISP